MEYPFEFDEMNLTEDALDRLGYTEYWSGCGDFGERFFSVKRADGVLDDKRGCHIVTVQDTMEDGSAFPYGYDDQPCYTPSYYSGTRKGPKTRTLYFIHDLYEDIAENAPLLLDIFIEQTKKEGVNMYPYIKSYLDYKERQRVRTEEEVIAIVISKLESQANDYRSMGCIDIAEDIDRYILKLRS